MLCSCGKQEPADSSTTTPTYTEATTESITEIEELTTEEETESSTVEETEKSTEETTEEATEEKSGEGLTLEATTEEVAGSTEPSEKENAKKPSEKAIENSTKAEVTPISVTATVIKTKYAGETLSGTDLTITVMMSDKSQLTNPPGWSIDTSKKLVDGNNNFAVAYKDVSTTINVVGNKKPTKPAETTKPATETKVSIHSMPGTLLTEKDGYPKCGEYITNLTPAFIYVNYKPDQYLTVGKKFTTDIIRVVVEYRTNDGFACYELSPQEIKDGITITGYNFYDSWGPKKCDGVGDGYHQNLNVSYTYDNKLGQVYSSDAQFILKRGYVSEADYKEVFKTLNDKRKAAGQKALAWDDNLYAIAKQRALELKTDEFSHKGAQTPEIIAFSSLSPSRFKDGYFSGQYLELDDLKECIDAWSNSPAHSNIMTDDGFTKGAVCVYVNHSGARWSIAVFGN